MARLIIGHTAHNTCKIWVRGDRRNPVAFLTVMGDELKRSYKMTLQETFGFTGVFNVKTLQPESKYECSVSFGETEGDRPEARVEYGQCIGGFRTFPAPGEKNNLNFLFGSCNLHSLGIIQNPDPKYRTLLKLVRSDSVDLMIHCGDQIYYDIPGFMKDPDVKEYREKYIDAWGDSRPTRKLLTVLPHYMMMDDHELVNNFSNDMDTPPSGASPDDIKKHGVRVYREFQHIHNPHTYGNQALYYHFNYGEIQIFCMDTRTERQTKQVARDGAVKRSMMIDDVQMGHLKRWLTRHRDAVKFVISSVPFVGHVENSNDKWCGDSFRSQREEIIEHILVKEISGVTFLTGDMHNSYHATMEVASEERAITIHELMSSPINQMSKSSLGKYVTNSTVTSKNSLFKYTSKINQTEFYNDHSNIVMVKVRNNKITYEIIRTKNGDRKELVGSYIAS